MNELKVNGSQEFMGIDIPIIEGGFGEDKKCISDKTISIIHNTSNPEVRRLIKDNIKRFTESIDFIDLKQRVGDTHTLELLQVLCYAKQSITQAEHIYLLSERGYAKLIKIMDTDIAWETHVKLIDEYFVLRKQVSIMLSEEDKYILKLYHADTKEEMLMIAKQHEQEIVQPLRDSVDRYERFLCEKTGMLTKTDLATKLDTKTQTLAARLKKVGVYTKTSQISGDFLKKYPDTKIVIECDNTYTDTNGNEHTKSDFQWTFEGAKVLVDYLIELGMVTYTDNNGFKLNVA
jgi:hypothetical protein